MRTPKGRVSHNHGGNFMQSTGREYTGKHAPIAIIDSELMSTTPDWLELPWRGGPFN